MKLKLCGLSRSEDIEAANACMPDYVGFVFASSPRQVTVEQAADLRQKLHPNIKAVGVFVDETVFSMADTAHRAGLDVIQLHGSETEFTIRELKDILPQIEVWRALRLQNAETLYRAAESPADMLLVDAFSQKAQGGTGKIADWPLLAAHKPARSLFLAGGLALDNIAEAVKLIQPFGLDISSGIETAGVKDPAKMKAVTELVRSLSRGESE